MRLSVSLPLSLSLLATAITTAVSSAQAAEEPVYELITTAIHRQQSETALPVTVLTGEGLHSQVRATLGDTLANQPGISNASFGPAVGQTVIRGQQGRRVMNLTNAMPNIDASGNSADHAQSVEPLLAESVEVLRGPATLLYGSGAIGGVVNVLDRRIARRALEVPAFAFESRHDSAADNTTVVGSADFSAGSFNNGSFVWHLDGMQREWNDMEIPGFAIDPDWLAFEAAREAAHDHDHDHDHDHAEHGDLTANSKGFIANTGGRTRSWTLGSSWVGAQGHIGLAASRLDNRYGLPPGAHGHGDAHDEHHDHDHDHDHEHGHVHEAVHGADEHLVFIDMEHSRYDLDAEWRGLASWAEKIQYRLSYSDYAHAEIEAGHGSGTAGEASTRYYNQAWQQRLQITHTDTHERHGILGLQHSSEEFAALGAESFIPVTDIRSSGIFLIEDFHHGALTFELGGRFNHDDYSPQQSSAPRRSFDTWSFSGSALWDLNASTTLALAVSRSQRAPSVEELYSNFGLSDPHDCVIHFATGSCELGSVDFEEETSLNTDLTLNFELGPLASTLTLFHNRFNDYIGQVGSGLEVDGFPIQEYHQDNARFVGVELDSTLQLSEALSMRVFADSVRGWFDHNGDAPRLPPLRYGMNLDFSRDAWRLNLSVLHAQAQDRPGLGEFATDSWTRIDAGADYRMRLGQRSELLLFIKARNLGDEDIRLSTSFLRKVAPEAGRSLETGLRFSF